MNPIGQMSGQSEFNEVVFEDAFMPDDHVLGEIDGAWKQATSELAYERSGPERFLETHYVLTELVRALGKQPDVRGAEGVGRLVAQLHTLRRMSVSVAGMLQAGKEPVVEASIVKDIGTIAGAAAAAPRPRSRGVRGARMSPTTRRWTASSTSPSRSRRS